MRKLRSMIETERALLEECRTNFNDGFAPLLIYADWLEEQGDSFCDTIRNEVDRANWNERIVRQVVMTCFFVQSFAEVAYAIGKCGVTVKDATERLAGVFEEIPLMTLPANPDAIIDP